MLVMPSQPCQPWSSFKKEKNREQCILYCTNLLISLGNALNQDMLPPGLKEYDESYEYLDGLNFCKLMHNWIGNVILYQHYFIYIIRAYIA